jgi:5-methylcytosine-specific restriction enzyme subunit McrC
VIVRRVVEVDAWSKKGPVELTAEEIGEIERSGLADVLAEPGGGFWIRTASKVGIAVSDELELRVAPHLDVPRLMFLLGYAKDPNGWKRFVATYDDVDDLLSAIASGFSWHATWAIDRGVLRGYVHRDEREIALRGRIRFGDQISRGGGLILPAEISYDDFTEDVVENRLLRTAASLLLRLPRIPEQARRRLLRLRTILAEVSELPVGAAVEAPAITRLNERYAPALALAELILSSASVGSGVGTTASTTFVFDMNKVFEDFVTIALRESLTRHGGELKDQVREKRLSTHIALKPDLAWFRDGKWAAVLDVKYKPLKDERFPNADAYQMLAYTLAFGLEKGWLVYAREPDQKSIDHAVPSAGKTLVVTALDVRREPDDLLAEVDALADRIAADVAGALAVAAQELVVG